MNPSIVCSECNEIGSVEWEENTPNFFCTTCGSTWVNTQAPPHPDLQNKGHHHFMDVVNAFDLNPQLFLNEMEQASLKAGATVVHAHVVELPAGGATSPPGFTAVCLLDESHVSAHYYEPEGLLAVDAFTCGKEDKAAMLIALLSGYISAMCPAAHTTHEHHTRRFNHA
jgi:S-adenosylmethionine/arginine decarboxylase-like enzyme